MFGIKSKHCRCLLSYCTQCIERLKAERNQLDEQVECLEEQLDQCKARNVELMSELSALQSVRDQLQAKTAECDKLAACNVGDLRNWHYCNVVCCGSHH